MDFILRSVLSLILLPPLGGCAAAQRPPGTGDVLRESKGLAPEWLTNGIVGGSVEVSDRDLQDEDELPVHFQISLPGAFEGVTHYMAGSVADYVECLLGVRFGTANLDILQRLRPDLVAALPEGHCGPCCSGALPLPEEVRAVLKEYWLAKLAE